MAFTATVLKKTVFGDMRVHHLHILADGASDSLDSGLDYLYCAQMSAKSVTTGAHKIVCNALTAATASNGTYAITGVASGDEFYLTLYGR